MRRDDPNREYVLIVAAALGSLCHSWFFQPVVSRGSENCQAREAERWSRDLPGLLTDENRTGVVLARLRSMAG